MPDPDVERGSALERENRILQRRLHRLQANVRELEEIQDSNSTILSALLRDLEAERARSQRLLLNVLPERIVHRLEAGEAPIADRHEAVAVLFSDFEGFTGIAAALAPDVLIAELNELFAGFDGICAGHGVEPLKTVGDAYLAIGGLVGGEGRAGVAATANAALEMRDFVGSRTAGAAEWRIRIGMHVGEVVAGVVGATRFAYDVWGDTVNVASRLETTAEPGQVHVSADVAAALGDRYRLDPRGPINLKGKGRMETFFLVGHAAPSR
jgi:adenylate cyclase